MDEIDTALKNLVGKQVIVSQGLCYVAGKLELYAYGNYRITNGDTSHCRFLRHNVYRLPSVQTDGIVINVRL